MSFKDENCHNGYTKYTSSILGKSISDHHKIEFLSMVEDKRVPGKTGNFLNCLELDSNLEL